VSTQEQNRNKLTHIPDMITTVVVAYVWSHFHRGNDAPAGREQLEAVSTYMALK
jgi:hypothetical protein